MIKRRQRGFTLIEILVVMVIIAMMAAMVALSIGSGSQRRELVNEAKRLHGVLRMAADEAVYQNVEIGVIIDKTGYEFVGYDEKQQAWTGLTQQFLRPHSFPPWMTLEFNREGQEVALTVKQGEKQGKAPQFVLLSSGESTPFHMRLGVDKDPDYQITISSDGINEIKYEEPGAE